MMPTPARLSFSTLVFLCGGALRAQLDYDPVGPDVVLNTDVTQIQPTQGPAYTVTGGVFFFRNVTIRPGVRVRGVGSNPMIWIVSGTFTVDGELSVNGEDGAHVVTLNTANIPAPGGRGGAGGGAGGDGTPSTTQRDLLGGRGLGPFGLLVGGGGGRLSCTTGTERGSGGGGGSFATEGDPFYLVLAGAGTSFQQQRGIGGQGGIGPSGNANRLIAGGSAGLRPFLDGRDDNDFFAYTVDVSSGRLIAGELTGLTGGQGGGGGGDESWNFTCSQADPNFANDASGGGGGGGGGCVVVFAQGPIVVGATGRVTANGGHGGGGEEVGSCNHGGGGGGGSGGMVVLATTSSLTLHVKGETYANNNYDFVLSADGGVCTTGAFGQPVVFGKYPANGTTQSPTFGNVYDSAPLGGFGGLGIVQLAAPFGNNADGTNTHLDDNIHLVRNGVPLNGNEKRRYLGWRGNPNALGVRVDDFGVALPVGRTDGDIRPAPVLVPVF